MAEPLEEAVEESWLEFLNRFDTEIYPTLFAPRGLTKAEAMIVFSLANMENAIASLSIRLEAE